MRKTVAALTIACAWGSTSAFGLTPDELARQQSMKPEHVAVAGVMGKTYDQLRDPDSLVVEDLFVRQSTNVLTSCFTFRAKNGFGGYNRSYAVWSITSTKKGVNLSFGVDKAAMWNKRCAGKSGDDQTDLAKYLAAHRKQ